MRKFVSVFISCLLLFSLTGCSEVLIPGSSEMPEIITSKTASMPSLEGTNLQEAYKELAELGFTSITANTEEDPEWDMDRWIVVEQSAVSGTEIGLDEQIQLNCKRLCRLYLDLKSNMNLFFNIYDLNVAFDGTNVGTIANGQNFSLLLDVMEGSYELVVSKASDASKNNSTVLTITKDMTYQCSIEHGSEIAFEHAVMLEGVSGASLEVADVEGMILSQAVDELKNLGFTSVHEEPYGQIWDMNNWIVLEQTPEFGAVVDKNTEIVLQCMSLDEYFDQIFTGRNLAQAQEIAREKNFELRCYSSAEDNADMNAMVSGMGEIEKTHWIIDKSRQYGAAIGTAVVQMHYVEDLQGGVFGWEDPLYGDALLLEELFPRADAADAIRVAFTNGQASDVFKADRESYDPAKFHDSSYEGEFACTITDYGSWSYQGEDSWHVEELCMQMAELDTAFKVTCNISCDGSSYILKDVSYVMAAEENLDSEDPEMINLVENLQPSKEVPYLTVNRKLIIREEEEENKAE